MDIREELGQGELRKWEDLNRDCLSNIFGKAGIEMLIWSLPFVCRNWYAVSLDPQCWKELDFNRPSRSLFRPYIRLHKIPFRELVKFAVKGLPQRCPMLKSLILPEYEYDDEEDMRCIPKLIRKWTHLEHLTLACGRDFHDILSEIRIHCKKFASLSTSICITDEATTAIVTLFPNIKSLNLRDSTLDRDNLVWIISECRELELLDVRDCEGFDEDDAEILEMASHIGTFMAEGSIAPYDDLYDCDYVNNDDYKYEGDDSDYDFL
ncbi:hypothetical protein ACHQM5_021402 [Ranunculus cassubicifolius]